MRYLKSINENKYNQEYLINNYKDILIDLSKRYFLTYEYIDDATFIEESESLYITNAILFDNKIHVITGLSPDFLSEIDPNKKYQLISYIYVRYKKDKNIILSDSDIKSVLNRLKLDNVDSVTVDLSVSINSDGEKEYFPRKESSNSVIEYFIRYKPTKINF